VGILFDAPGGLVDADEGQHLDGSCRRLRPCTVGMKEDGLGNLAADGIDGIERSHRILENNADSATAYLAHLFFGVLCDIFPVEQDFAPDDLAGLRQDAQDGIGGNAFTAAGFADDAEHLAFFEVEGKAVDGFDLAGVGEKGCPEVFHLQ